MGKQCDTHGKPQKETKLANLKLHIGLAKARAPCVLGPTVIRNAAKIFTNLHSSIHEFAFKSLQFIFSTKATI